VSNDINRVKSTATNFCVPIVNAERECSIGRFADMGSFEYRQDKERQIYYRQLFNLLAGELRRFFKGETQISSLHAHETEGVMKDQLITLLEALRAARLELIAHERGRSQNEAQTLQRLKDILFDEKTRKALVVLGAMEEAPSVVPAQDEGKQRDHARQK